MGDMLTGRIIRGIGGFYYVSADDGLMYECKAKGIFRKEGTKPLVGDFCHITPVEESDPDLEALPVGNIAKILPRKSKLLRPAVANVDQAMIIFALTNPGPNFGLLDTFLLRMELDRLPVIIVFNKTDLDTDGGRRQEVLDIYRPTGYELLFCSAVEGSGVEEIRERLKGKCTTVAGPSGVGKSSLINRLQGEVQMETSRISEKTRRGKHTTRHSELIPLTEGGYICDTPGFTSLGIDELEKEDIARGFREIGRWQEECRFAGCSHISEPDCRVKEKLLEGAVSRARYESYVRMYGECKDRKRF